MSPYLWLMTDVLNGHGLLNYLGTHVIRNLRSAQLTVKTAPIKTSISNDQYNYD